MKKVIALSFVLTLGVTAAAHALNWWEQPTICRWDTTMCYGTMTGPGFDLEIWDDDASCRGKKYICPDALTTNASAPVQMGRRDIATGTGINPDFDTSVLNPDEACFGVRRANGAQVAVNGRMVNVYCPGVLSRPDEIVANGEITYDAAHPTCAELAADGYVAVLNNGKCYGKYYSPDNYYIECGTALTPTRIIVLNGADVESARGAGTEKSAADALFDKMYTTSQAQKKQYFNQ